MPAKRGRPHELTPAIVADAQRLASEVEYLETLAPLLGIGKTALYTWLKRGSREQRRRDRGLNPKEAETIFVEFANAIKKGRAEAEKRSLDTIRAAADAGAWQAAAWRLERAYPERWSLQKSELARLRKIVKKLAEKNNIDPDTLEAKADE
jgi:transposase